MTESTRTYKPRNRPPASGRRLQSPMPEFLQGYRTQAVMEVASDFVGITADGTPEKGLYTLVPGADTSAIRRAAEGFLASLSSNQRARALHGIDDAAWRSWSNIHVFVMRHGALLEGLDDVQREAGLQIMRASLSDNGFQTARDIMRLNETIREITGRDDEYGEWPYWLSIMGEPSETQPWGWQIDGHHLIINCFVLGGQVVMTPMFMGSEPVHATTGKYAGTRVFESEERLGLRFMQSLPVEQQAAATIGMELPGDVFTTGFRDNFEMRYEGLPFSELSSAHQEQLLGIVDLYVGRMTPEHARLRMEEVRSQLQRTHFAWIGSHDDDSVFYYRIHSPVILIEFDHQRGIALDVDEHFKDHIHTVVRTPNGNDYGKDLLRQHYEQFDHSKGGHH